MNQALVILFLFVATSLNAQIKTVFFNEPYRLSLTYDNQWYLQNLNDLEDYYLYGDYNWNEDTLKLFSSFSSKILLSLTENYVILSPKNTDPIVDINYSTFPKFFFKQSEYYENGRLKSLLLYIDQKKLQKNRFKYNLAQFSNLGQLISIDHFDYHGIKERFSVNKIEP